MKWNKIVGLTLSLAAALESEMENVSTMESKRTSFFGWWAFFERGQSEHMAGSVGVVGGIFEEEFTPRFSRLSVALRLFHLMNRWTRWTLAESRIKYNQSCLMFSRTMRLTAARNRVIIAMQFQRLKDRSLAVVVCALRFPSVSNPLHCRELFPTAAKFHSILYTYFHS